MLESRGESAEPCSTPVDGMSKGGDSVFSHAKEEVQPERYVVKNQMYMGEKP